MKFFSLILSTLLFLTFSLEAGLAPQAIYNQKKRAYCVCFEICEIDDEKLLIAHYDKGEVYTVLDGPGIGFQWIEENGKMTACSEKIKWHEHSFIHTYEGGTIKTNWKNNGNVMSQFIFYKN